MKYQITPELLHKYLDGECTPNEAFMLYQWYDSMEEEADPLAELSAIEQEALKMLMLNNFKAAILTEGIKQPMVAKRHPVKLMYTLAGIAATLLIVGAGFFLVKRSSSASIPNDIVTTAAEQMEVNNLTGSIYKQILSDGSIVWLSPKSKLRYPKKFTGAYRQVKMTGEAFFEVTKDHTHPFIIYSGGVVTRVWGTSFRIRAYQDAETEVSVVTGKVSVKIPDHNNSEIMLLPKQKVVYQQVNNLLKREVEVRTSGMKMWQKTSVAFDNVPLSSVLNTLDKQFGMHMRTDDAELAKYPLKADFTDQNLPAILDMLEYSLNVSYTIDETEVILFRNKPANQ
jgi:transmembrane sensor